MRLGCSGCLVAVVLLAVAIVAVGGAIGAGRRVLATPDVAGLPTPTAADGSRAQRKVFDLVRHTRNPRPVTLTEAEVNALLMHHLVEARGVRIAAVGLASAHLANVANELGSVGPIWIGIFIATFFHALTLALAAFSPMIQSLRLQYVEFFGAFFVGGGRPFTPFGQNPTRHLHSTS